MKRKFVEKCFSLLIAGVFIFNVVMPYGWVSADELTDTPDIGVENEVVLAPSSTAQVRSNGTYTSTVDSVPDRWTVGDVIQYSCDAPAGADVTWSVTVSGVISVTDTGLVTALKQGYTILKAEWASNSMSTQVYVGTIPDGTYFIGNKQTGKYMDLEGAGTADGTNIQQWDFHGGVQSQWNITLDQYGYYLIQSAYTGKYVGVENSSSATNAKIKQYSFHRTSPGIRWLITPTASGAYKFTCQAAEGTNMVITVPSSGSTANGTDLIQYPYANNAVYRDEWYIGEKQIYVAYVNMYYDLGYCVHYADSQEQAVSNLNSYIAVVADRYYELFGLIIHAPDASYYNSLIDICKNNTVSRQNITVECNSTNAPHSNCTVLFNSVHNHFSNFCPGNNIMTAVYWSGHRIRTEIGSDELNRCYSHYKQVYMIQRILSFDRRIKSPLVLMHELNHQYNAPDHYHEDLGDGTCRGGDLCYKCGINARPKSCIMAGYDQSIDSPTIICDGCKADILAHLADHHGI